MTNDQLYDKCKSLEEKLIKSDHEKMELISAYKDLLDEAIYLYNYYPNNFRKTADEYFEIDKDLLKKYS